MMRSGSLRHRIDIQQKNETQDDFGSPVETWTDLYSSVPANVRPVSSADKFAAQQINPQISHEVKIRYIAGLTTEMRIMFGSRVFEIAAPPINWQERYRELSIMCVERV